MLIQAMVNFPATRLSCGTNLGGSARLGPRIIPALARGILSKHDESTTTVKQSMEKGGWMASIDISCNETVSDIYRLDQVAETQQPLALSTKCFRYRI